MNLIRLIPVLLALAAPLAAQVAVKYTGATGRRSEPAAYKVPSTFSDTFEAGSTLTVNGTFSGTPTAGTLDLSNVTVTLNGSYLMAAQVNGYFADPSTNGSFSASAWRTDLSVLTAAEIAAAYQPLDSDLTAIAGLATTSYGRSFLTLADASAARTLIGAVIGTNVQAYHANLTQFSNLSLVADRLPYANGTGTLSLATFTNFGRNLIDDADASAGRTTLGLGTIATQAASSVSITGGSITGITDLAIADGGTGQSTAPLAFAALKQDATTSATGVVELANTAEALAGSSTSLVPPVSAMEARVLNGTITLANAPSYFSDGATSNRRLEATPGSPGAIAGMPATFWVKRFFVPPSNPSVTGWFLVLSGTGTSADFANAANTLSGYLTSSGELVLRQNDGVSPTLNFRRLGWTNFQSTYSGRWVQIAIVFEGGDTTTNPKIYINGADITASFTLNPAGTPPNWMPTTLDTTKFVGGFNWSAGPVPEVEYGPGAWTAAEALTAAQTGLAPTWWRGFPGSAVNRFTGDSYNFSGGVGTWIGGGSGGGSVTADAANSELDCTTSGASGYAASAASTGYMTAGRRYQFSVTLRNVACVSGATLSIVTGGAGANNTLQTGISADGTYSYTFTAAGPATGVLIAQAGAGSTSFSVFQPKLYDLGPVAKWEIQPGQSVAKDYGTNGIPLTLASGISAVGIPKEINDNGSGRRTLDKPLTLSGTTASTSTTTGELVVGGGGGFSGSLYAASIQNTPIGSTTASTGAFTTLSASSTVSGTGFSTYLASPPAIGGTTPAAGAFTTLSASAEATLPRITQAPASLTYSGTTNLDFASTNQTRTLALTGNVTFTTSNRVAGRSLQIIITADGSTRTLSFPAWKFLGTAAPANLAAGKTAVLSLYCTSTTDASIIATYVVEP